MSASLPAKLIEWVTFAFVNGGIVIAAAGLRHALGRWDVNLFSTDDISAPRSEKFPWGRWVTGLAISILLIYFAPHRDEFRPVDPVDEGMVLAAAQQIQKGGRAYQDVSFHYGPLLEFAEPFLAFKWFGETAYSYRQVHIVLERLAFAILFLIAWIGLRRRWLALVVPFVYWMRPDLWVSERSVFAMIALICLIPRNRGLSWMAGVWMVIAYFYSMETGLLTMAAWTCYWLLTFRDNKEYGKWTAIGIASAAVPVLLYLAGTGRVHAFISNALFPSHFLEVASRRAPSILDALGLLVQTPWRIDDPALYGMRWYFPVFFFSAALGFCRQDHTLRLLSLSSIAFFLIAMSRSDYDHWMKGTAFLIPTLTIALDRLFSVVQRPTHTIVRVTAVLLSVFLLRYMTIHMDLWAIPHALQNGILPPAKDVGQPQTLHRLGPLTIQGIPTAFNTLIPRIQERSLPSDGIYVLSDDALIYFLTDRKNSTPYMISAVVRGNDRVQETLARLKSTPPACIVLRAQGSNTFGKPDQQPIVDWVLEHYTLLQRAEPFFLYVLKRKGAL